MALTISKIAELANVSRGTVDRVIHNRPNVSKKAKDRVLKIIDELGYTPNLAAKALVSKNKGLLFSVVMAPDFNPFVSDVKKGVENAYNEYKSFGVEVDIEVINTLNAEEQLKILDKLERQGVRGIAIVPIACDLIVQRINQLIEKGIDVVTFNSDIKGTNRLCFVGQDNEKAGKVAFELMENIVPKDSKVGVIISSLNLECHQNRLTGFVAKLSASKSGLKTVAINENQDKDELSYDLVMSFCKNNPDLKGIYVTGGGVTGVGNALKECNMHNKVKVISHDIVAPVIKLMKEGIIKFTIGQDPYTQGAQPVKILFDYIFKKIPPEKEVFYTGVDIRTLESL